MKGLEMFQTHQDLLCKIAFILLLVGGIDLGLFGLIHVDFITAILGSFLARIVFILIGLSAVYKIYLHYFVKKGGH